MSRLRRGVLAIGALAVVAGVALAALGAEAGTATLPVAVVALAALAALVAALLGLRRIRPRSVDPPRQSVTYGVPGERFGARLRALSSTDRVDGATDERRAVRETVAEVAADVLSSARGIDRGTARRHIDAGDWPADDAARAFFAGDPLPDRSRVDAARELLTGETVFGRRARRAVDALYGLVESVPDDEGEPTGAEPAVAVADETERTTRRWRPVAVLALLTAGVGAASGRPALVVTGAVGLAFVAHGRLGREEAPALAAERTVAESAPAPDETVEIEVSVTNEAGRFLPHVHLVDPVPPGLTVVEGSREATAALRDGERVALSYAVRAARGTHEFDGPMAVTRDLAGARERVRRLDGDGRLTCVPPLSEDAAVGVRPSDALRVGPSRTPRAGAGLEFHSVREYRAGDPLSRVDWRGLARSGDLRTVEYHRERSVSVVIVVDARRAAYCAPSPDGPPAVERCVAAARDLAGSLLEGGHRVGVAALSPIDCWVAPGLGTDHRDVLRRTLATHPALSWTPPDETSTPRERLRERVARTDSVVFCSPLCDDAAAEVARDFDGLGHETTVVAPDPTADGTQPRRFARLRRRTRIRDLRRAGVPVVNWSRAQALDAALRRGAEP